MASSSFNLHEPLENITISSGTSYYSIEQYCGWKEGNHIHVEVYGTYNSDNNTSMTIPFFTISGIAVPSARQMVGTVIIRRPSEADTIWPGFASFETDGYIHQRVTAILTNGAKVMFIVDIFKT